VSRGVHDVSVRFIAHFHIKRNAIRAGPTLILRKSISRDSRVVKIDERRRDSPIKNTYPMIRVTRRGEPVFSPIIRILLIINMEMFYVASVVYSARINSSPPYKYSSLFMSNITLFLFMYFIKYFIYWNFYRYAHVY